MNKKIVVLIISLIAVLIGMLAIILMINNTPKEEIKTYTVEVYDWVRIKDLTGDDNEEKIDTTKIGKQTIKYDDKEIIVEVKDTTPPYIGLKTAYNHIKDTNFTFEKDVICTDNYDRNIKCEIIGEYDLTTLGEYDVKVVAKDSSNNKTEKDIIFRVIDKSSVNNTVNHITIKEAKKNMPEGAALMIDVSKWEQVIDWKKVKEAGIDYAMIRLGTQKAIDEGSVLDEYFERNITEAQKNGVKVGVYYYSYANDIEDAKVQAEWVLEHLKGHKLDLPVAFDWECWFFFNSFDISLHDINEIARTFLSIIQEKGYDVVNYGSKNYMENVWDLDEYGVWLAHYTDKTNYEGKYIMWQFTDAGRVDGVNKNVDMDYYFVNNVE